MPVPTKPKSAAGLFRPVDQSKQGECWLGWKDRKADYWRKNFDCRISAQQFVMSGDHTTDGIKVKYVNLDLTGTHVGPVETPSTRGAVIGPFTDRVVITVTPSHPAATLEWEAPYSASDGHVTTYTVSFQGSASGGLFGGQGIANVGAGFSVAEGASVEFKDWDVENHTHGPVMRHEYFMAAAGKRAYDRGEPGSGVFPPMSRNTDFLTGFSHLDQVVFDQGLEVPPHLSLSNFPVVSHGLWSLTEALEEPLTFAVTVSARFVMVGVHQGLLAEYSRWSSEFTWETSAVAPLQDIGT